MRQLVRIGVQWDTQVTIRGSKHTVTQAYCSDLPVAYSQLPSEIWEKFARLVLEAAYEATLCVGALNGSNTGSMRVHLTLLGGGAFGNKNEWIIESIHRALSHYSGWNLEVSIVIYSESKHHVRGLVYQFA